MKLNSSILVLITVTSVHSATIVDDFESNSLTGGSGWSNDWTAGGSGGFVGGNVISGNHAGALFGTSSLVRNFSAITSGTVTATWSIKGLGGSGNFNEIGVNLLGLKSNNQTNIITLKFDDSNTSTLFLNDGGSDFTQGTVGYTDNTIYDFTLSAAIGGDKYSWSVIQRGGGTASGTDFTFSGSGTTLTNVSGIAFFWSADAGAGNDGFIDNVSIIPEPSSALLGALGALMLLRRRRN